jgi:hypothetical protein
MKVHPADFRNRLGEGKRDKIVLAGLGGLCLLG